MILLEILNYIFYFLLCISILLYLIIYLFKIYELNREIKEMEKYIRIKHKETEKKISSTSPTFSITDLGDIHQ